MINIIPKKGLPPLGSLIDTEESSIELTDKDFDNEFTEDEYREELYDLTDADFGNYDEVEDDYSEYEYGSDLSDEDFQEVEENNYDYSNIPQYDEELEEDYKESEYQEPPIKKGSINNKKKPIDFKKYYKIISIIIAIIVVIIVLVIAAKAIGKKVEKTKHESEESSSKPKKIEITEEKEIEDSFETIDRDGFHYVVINLSKDTSGIYQESYLRKDGKIIICETVSDYYSANEPKESELSCYNLDDGETLETLKKNSGIFIED